MRRRNRYLLVLLAVIVVVGAARAALPSILEHYINDKLDSLQVYEGSISGIDVALLRGAYSIEGLQLRKRNGDRQTPFLGCERIDLALQWPSLLKGAIVGKGSFQRPSLSLIKGPSEQLGNEVDWGQQLEKLFPFRFDTLTVHDGTVSFRAPGIRAPEALVAHHVEASVSNLTNVTKQQGQGSFASFNVTANVLDTGTAHVFGTVNPLPSTPTFEVHLEVEHVLLPKMNPWLQQYLKADASSGEFEVYIEVAAADGHFKGYAKPLMQHVKLRGMSDEHKSLLRKLWEGFLNVTAKVLEDPQKKQVGARIPLSGTIENPKAGVLPAIVSVLHNAFIGAFANSLDGSISLRDVKKGLEPYELQQPGSKEKEPQHEEKDDSQQPGVPR
jgi:Domain of Unknown Function (DUF748)